MFFFFVPVTALEGRFTGIQFDTFTILLTHGVNIFIYMDVSIHIYIILFNIFR